MEHAALTSSHLFLDVEKNQDDSFVFSESLYTNVLMEKLSTGS